MRLNITKAGARKAAGDVLAWAITWLVIVAMGHRSQDSAARNRPGDGAGGMTTIEAQMWGSFWVLMLAACYFVRAERVLRAARAEREALAAEQTRIEAARGALARQQASLIESEARITGMIVEAEAERAKLETLRRGLIEGLGCWDLGMREEAFEALRDAGVEVKA